MDKTARSNKIDLSSLCVMVTRPKPQGEILCQRIRDCNGRAIYFPTIEIIATGAQNPSFPKNPDWIIFISPQAVYHGAHLLPLPLPPQVKVAAIGLGTAKVLEERKIIADLYPEEWNSEGLLKLPEFQNMMGRQVIIVQGMGGREILAKTLAAKGAIVTQIIAYQRVLPKVDIKPYTHLLHEHKIDIIVCTSLEGIRNLLQLFGEENQPYLQRVTMVVISERLKESIKDLGFTRVITAKNASHESILKVLSREKGSFMPKEELQSSKENKPTKSKSIRLANIGILFSVFGVIALVAALYFIYEQFGVLYANLSQVTHTLQKESEKTMLMAGQFPQQIQQIQDELNKQTQSIADLRKVQGQHPDQWRVLEAQYLVKLANEQLQFTQDVSVAEKLLEAANDDIKNLPDPNLQNVRKVLAVDISHLQSVQQINVEDTYLHLVGLNEKLDQLPLIVQQVNSPKTETKQELSQAPWWKKGLQQTWQTLQKIVVVQHADHQIPLLTPEQREFLYLNLHAKIETAIWGLLHHQPVVYQTSLTQITTWVKHYFVPDAPLTQSVLTGLAELQKLNVQSPALSVNDSLQAFQSYFQSQSSETHS